MKLHVNVVKLRFLWYSKPPQLVVSVQTSPLSSGQYSTCRMLKATVVCMWERDCSGCDRAGLFTRQTASLCTSGSLKHCFWNTEQLKYCFWSTVRTKCANNIHGEMRSVKSRELSSVKCNLDQEKKPDVINADLAINSIWQC